MIPAGRSSYSQTVLLMPRGLKMFSAIYSWYDSPVTALITLPSRVYPRLLYS
jgi:hypothetical protein